MSGENVDYLEIFARIDFKKIVDHPNILIAASFWDEERYQAAKTCYKFMRSVDDLVDNHKSAYLKFSDDEKKKFLVAIGQWLDHIKKKVENSVLFKELSKTIEQFKIPAWPFEAFARSMMYDINHDGFATLQDFLDYAEGASVAPASIFVHLCGLKKDHEQYHSPVFDVKEAALPCAVFSYLVHIIRDFQKDQSNNLNYFADDILAKYGLMKDDLKKIAKEVKIPKEFRLVIKEYYNIADEYRLKTYNMIQSLWPYLEARYRLSLEIIFNLYLMVYERFEVESGNFTTRELNPTHAEIKQRVFTTIQQFQRKESNYIKF
jgi:phytoene/squalene synthetase